MNPYLWRDTKSSISPPPVLSTSCDHTVLLCHDRMEHKIAMRWSHIINYCCIDHKTASVWLVIDSVYILIDHNVWINNLTLSNFDFISAIFLVTSTHCRRGIKCQPCLNVGSFLGETSCSWFPCCTVRMCNNFLLGFVNIFSDAKSSK